MNNLITIVGPVVVFVVVIGFAVYNRYLQHKETMALAEKGLLPAQDPSDKSAILLRWGMIFSISGAVLVLVLFVLPRFSDLLLSSGTALPATTAAVVGVAMTVQEQWWVVAAVPLLVFAGLGWLRTTDAGRRTSARTLVRLPLVGAWRRQHLGASFARMVGELLAGGAPLILALQDARDCMTDSVAQEETDRIRVQVSDRGSLHASIAEGGLFPPVLSQLVALGEDSGRLSDFLLKAAELLERKTEQTLERLVALLEPAMIVGFGGIVAVVALALLQAIYGVNAGSF